MADGQSLFGKTNITETIFGEAGLPDTSGTYGTLGAVLGVAANLIIGLGFAYGILSIGWSAILYIFSEGDKDKTTQAWHSFLYGAIACAIAIGALAIKSAVLGVIGVTNPEISGDQISF